MTLARLIQNIAGVSATQQTNPEAFKVSIPMSIAHVLLYCLLICIGGLSIGACGSARINSKNDDLPNPNDQSYTIVVADFTSTISQQGKSGQWEVVKTIMEPLSLSNDRWFSQCMAPSIEKVAPVTIFLDQQRLNELAESQKLDRIEAAKRIGLSYLIILTIKGERQQHGSLKESPYIPMPFLPLPGTITGDEDGNLSSKIDAKVYDLRRNTESEVSTEVMKPYWIKGWILFPTWNIPRVHIEACERIGVAVGEVLREKPVPQ